jgi:OOP family OmpA-OmpF porin
MMGGFGFRMDGRYVGYEAGRVFDEFVHNFELTLGILFSTGTGDKAPAPKPVSTPVPGDVDGDGVVDNLDACPDTPAGAKVDKRGCNVDNDGDGVVNQRDKCPKTPQGAAVNSDGCAKDSDGDGVADYKDKCPKTEQGKKVDSKGCPTESIARGVLNDVTFELGKDVLTESAKVELDKVATALNQFPNVPVEVQGHTDSSGDDNYNMFLSGKRAESVKNYLISKGVDGTRLTAKGYGETKPVADNGTRDGRKQNRRVELKWLD